MLIKASYVYILPEAIICCCLQTCNFYIAWVILYLHICMIVEQKFKGAASST